MLGLSAVGEWPPLFEAEASVTGLPDAECVAVPRPRCDVAAARDRASVSVASARSDVAPA